MRNNFSKFSSLLVLCLLAVVSSLAQGTPISASGSVPISLTIPESLTLSLSGGPFVIPATPNTWSNIVSATVTYNLVGANHSQGIWVATWLGSATAALTNGSTNIPASQITYSGDGNPGSPCTLGAGVHGEGNLAGATCADSLDVISVPAVPAATMTDTFKLEYTGSIVNAGAYSGTYFVTYIAP